ncbi:hypothetical protein C8J44_0011 [Sphingomonas sp. PP-CE-3A-406]|nr:hypothetical protein C8J47_0122 [Sphingomonas sp. PP-F2F-G114-C0414]RMB54788.1 hypothetical protein C8J44_0011 [Sphingomonas sp. PP-CE-3A-406]
MALIPCPECRQSVSDIAPACPRCGYPVAGSPRSRRMIDSGVAGKAVGAIGGWLIVPWIARLVAMAMFCLVLIVMFIKGRG